MTKDELIAMGMSRTVFSNFYPETREIIKQTLNHTANDQSDYEFAYTGSQDRLHLGFLSDYKKWSKDAVKADWDSFPHAYPTNGSSEAIREQIAYLKAQGYKTIYTFKGEYEGYAAIAQGMDMSVVTFSRDADVSNWQFVDKGAFFLSQPSSIDGSVWSGYDSFMQGMNDNHPEIPVYVDLCYVGCVATEFTVDVTYPNIDGVFFSLSKVFGVYYHRIGGVFLKENNPLLYGNMWFKNLLSMKIGQVLMANYGLFDLPRKYVQFQEAAVDALNKEYRLNMKPADVVLLANAKRTDISFELDEALQREPSLTNARICLTPMVEGKPLEHYTQQEVSHAE